jgi:hypothetical protein
MSDIRKYRGYIIQYTPSKEEAEDWLNKVRRSGPIDYPLRWAVKFLEFPTLEIFSGGSVLEAMPSGSCVCGRLLEECFDCVMCELMNRLKLGLYVPQPHEVLPYKPFVEIQVDIDLICQNLGFKGN